jgi:hypothetical protein
VRSGRTLHGKKRLPATHSGAGRTDTVHVHHCCPRHCGLQAAEMQGQTSLFYYSKLTKTLPFACVDLAASDFLNIQIVFLS